MMLCFFVFFFKQKTAYEMRISDWSSDVCSSDLVAAAAGPATPRVPAVTALVETVPAGSYGDAADDPAIWANPGDPAASLVIATDTTAGLYVYDMRGQVVQFLPAGKLTHAHLRGGLALSGEQSVLVTANHHTHATRPEERSAGNTHE